MKSPRRYARIKAFQTLFQLAANPDPNVEEALYFAVDGVSEFEKVQDEDLIEAIASELSVGKDIAVDTQDFLIALVEGTWAKRDELDQLISEHLHQWRLERLDLVTLTLLRLGAYELLYYPEISSSVILNEIVEMAKIFSDKQMSKFTNGVLQGIADDKRA